MTSDFTQFAALAKTHTLVPVVRTLHADLLTPVSAFLAIAGKESQAFLLESVERGEHVGRYTFLGVRPYMTVSARHGEVMNGGNGNRGRVHFLTGEQFANRRVGFGVGLGSDGFGAGHVGIDYPDQLDRFALLLQLVVNAGVIAPESATTNDGEPGR